MRLKRRMIRLIAGLAAMLGVLSAGFTIAYLLLPTYGATAEETTQALPGDEMLDAPIVHWRHAITIQAPPEQVWPWIIQMGDTRAAFYSYMFIERLIDPSAPYINADRIHPEWQNPPIKQGIIADQMLIHAYEADHYLLAVGSDPTRMGWTWLWHIAPHGENQTRLNVHMAIQTPPEVNSPALTVFMNLGAFIMERNMITGLKLRAEGGSEPAWVETVEIGLWFLALLTGAAAAYLFLTRPDWRLPLAVGLAAIIALQLFTFLQPPIILRALANLVLIAGLAWQARSDAAHRPAAMAK